MKNFGSMPLVLAIPVVVVILLLAVFMKKSGHKRKGRLVARQPVSRNEQPMFWRLTETFPQPMHVVLAQVSFGALLAAKEGASRWTFSQKMADFVLLDRSFKVLAVIELDDGSHKGREDKDTERDDMLRGAGYKVVRFKTVPQPDALRAAVAEGLPVVAGSA